MKPLKTTARPPADLDATDELPALDPAAYEAELLSREAAGSSDGRPAVAESDPAAAGAPASEHRVPNTAPPGADPDDMLAVEHWIAEKSEELRAHREALSLAQRERTAAVARAEALNLELGETSAKLETLSGRERALTEALAGEQEAAQREAGRLAQELAGARAMEMQHKAALAALQAQLASCLESLHNRESYRAIYESTLQQLDAELAAARLLTAEQEARANQLGAELQTRDRGLQTALRERDEARQLHDMVIARQAAERGEAEQRRSALESQLAALTAKHADGCAQLLAMEAALTAAQQRAAAEALASGTAAERLRELESVIASRQTELTNARLEIERDRALLAELTAALARSQTMLSDQRRLLEEREATALSMAASHAEQTALIANMRGQIEELTARLAAPEAERRALEERVAALTKEGAEKESRLTRLESMNAELRATVGQQDTLLAERDAELQRATQIASMNAYALGRVQSSIDELGRTLAASEGASAQAQASILTRIDGGQNHSVLLRGRTTIGRDPDNDLPLAVRSVSRHHAVLIPAFRTAFVQDLRSTNGVLVNQRRVRCARLEHGDVVSIGEAQFRYTVTPAPARRGV